MSEAPNVERVSDERLKAIIANPIDIIGISEGVAMARELLAVREGGAYTDEERAALEYGAHCIERHCWSDVGDVPEANTLRRLATPPRKETT